jgi:hypothetical protein
VQFLLKWVKMKVLQKKMCQLKPSYTLYSIHIQLFEHSEDVMENPPTVFTWQDWKILTEFHVPNLWHLKITVFYDMIPYSLLDRFQRFTRTCFLHLQNNKVLSFLTQIHKIDKHKQNSVHITFVWENNDYEECRLLGWGTV